MKKNALLFIGFSFVVSLVLCGCTNKKAKTYNVADKKIDSTIEITLAPENEEKALGFLYTSDKIDVGKVNDDGSITFYTEEEKKKQIDEIGRKESLEIVEENGNKINFSAYPGDDPDVVGDDFDEYVYTIGNNIPGINVAKVHIFMNEEAFKNRLQKIKENYVPEGMDIYSDRTSVQILHSNENALYGDVLMRWVSEARKGYMIEIFSPDYSFADISCAINLKEEFKTSENGLEAEKSEEEMIKFIENITKESTQIEKKIPQDNIASFVLPQYDEEGYLVSGVSLFDDEGNIVNIAEDKEHKWCYDEKGWIVRADTVETPYTLEYKAMDNTRYGDLVPIKQTP